MSDEPRLHDVVIVGAGVAGSIIADALGRAGVQVLLLEAANTFYFDRNTGADQRQPLLDRYYEETVREPNSPFPDPPGVVMPRAHELDKHYYGTAYGSPDAPAPPPARRGQWSRFASTYTRIVGGTTYHWLGTCLRHEPATFRERTLYHHSVDWPIGYDDLEDWYWKAERELGVAGDAEHPLGAPRNGRSYPMPPIPPSWTDRVMAERLRGERFEGVPLLVEPTPQARNSVPYQGRPVCAGSSNCVPICPIQAKYDATVHLKRALQHERADGTKAVEPRTGVIVSKVLVGAEGTITGLEVLRPHELTGGQITHEVVQGRIYVLATHAIETARILLNSCSDQQRLERGAANSSDCVGRHLMDHPVRIAWGEADVPLHPFRGPLSTSGIETLRDGLFRRARAPFRVEIEAIGTQWARNTPLSTVSEKLAANVIGKGLWERVGWDASRQLQINALFEPRPHPDSRVTLAKDAQGRSVVDALGIPRPRIDVILDDSMIAGAAVFERLADLIVGRMSGGRQPKANIVDHWYGSGHAMGTHRMGTCRRASVTDSWGQCWDHPNLWLTGSGLFPTAGTANPTLTLVALALRQVDRLIEALRRCSKARTTP